MNDQLEVHVLFERLAVVVSWIIIWLSFHEEILNNSFANFCAAKRDVRLQLEVSSKRFKTCPNLLFYRFPNLSANAFGKYFITLLDKHQRDFFFKACIIQRTFRTQKSCCRPPVGAVKVRVEY